MSYDIMERLYSAMHPQKKAGWDDVVRLHNEASALFAAANGWELFNSDFRPEDIGKRSREYHIRYGGNDLYDHCLYYRKVDGFSRGDRPRRIYQHVAIVAQPYAHLTLDKAQAIVAPLGLTVRIPPAGPLASFWYPGSTGFYVVVKPEEAVNFLHEQHVHEERWNVRNP